MPSDAVMSGGSDSASPAGGPSNLQLRLATAAVGLPLLAVVTWLGGWPFALVGAGVAFMAATEFVHGWLIPSRPVKEGFRFWAVAAASSATVLLAHSDERAPLGAALLAVFCAAVGYGPTRVIGPRRPYRVFSWCLTYVAVLLSSLVLLRDLDHGREWFFLALLSTFATDTGAYAVGRIFGRHKMAPRISPKKTWEGAVGGYACGFGAVVGLAALLDPGVSVARVLPLAALLPIAAEAGDLLESWMKRRMGIKDASRLLPGHGGFLDRLDSVVAVMPLVYVYVRLFVD